MPIATAALAVPEVPVVRPEDVLIELRSLLASGDTLQSPVTQLQVGEWRRMAAEVVFASAQRPSNASPAQVVEAMLAELRKAGASDYASPAEQVKRADELADAGWPGVLAAMVLVPSWQWTKAPALRDVPVWMIPAAAEYLFTAPKVWTAPGQREAYTERYVAAATDLAALVEANRGSAAVRKALESFQLAESAASYRASGRALLRIRAAHARVLTALHRSLVAEEGVSFPREGRRLRIGVVARDLDASPALSSFLPMVERLDASKHELVLLTLENREAGIQQQLAGRGATHTWLMGNTEEVLQTLRYAALDVAVFVVDGPLTQSPVAPLALARVAPVQLVHDGANAPSLLPACDIYLAGSSALSATAGERAAVVPGLLVGVNELSAVSETEPWTRAAMGLEENDIVLTVLAQPEHLSFESTETLISVLRSVPAAKLVVVSPTEPSAESERWSAQLCGRLAAESVDRARVAVFSGIKLESHQDRKSCLAASDFVLVLEREAGETALAAMDAGVPVLALGAAQDPWNATTGMLQATGYTEFAAADTSSLIEVLRKLADDKQVRTALAEQLRATARSVLASHDSFVRSEVFGRLAEIAFDGIFAAGRRFGRERHPLTVQIDADPATLAEETRFFLELGSGADAESRARAWLVRAPESTEARAALARAIGVQGRHADAAAMWLSLVELLPNDADAWYQLALNSSECGRSADAVQAVEATLRLNPRQVDAWLLLARLAERAGDSGMQQDAIGVLRELAPSDPKVVEFLATNAA